MASFMQLAERLRAAYQLFLFRGLMFLAWDIFLFITGVFPSLIIVNHSHNREI